MIPAGHKAVGEIVGAFGIRGALKVEPRTDFPQRFAKGAVLHLGERTVTIVETTWHKGQARIQTKEITDPDEARGLAGSLLSVPSQEAPKLKAGEYLTETLVGCRLVDERHGDLGEVDSVERGPLYDFLRRGGLLIPAIKEFVKKVDLKNRVIHVALIEGMKEEI